MTIRAKVILEKDGQAFKEFDLHESNDIELNIRADEEAWVKDNVIKRKRTGVTRYSLTWKTYPWESDNES